MHYDSTRCSVCKHRISSKQKQKAFPCPQCMTLVHRKCCNISTYDLLHVKPKHLANWSCTTCLSEMFPLNNTEDTDVASLTYNSLVDCPCNNQTVSIPLHLCETFKYAKQFTQKDSYPTVHAFLFSLESLLQFIHCLRYQHFGKQTVVFSLYLPELLIIVVFHVENVPQPAG